MVRRHKEQPRRDLARLLQGELKKEVVQGELKKEVAQEEEVVTGERAEMVKPL